MSVSILVVCEGPTDFRWVTKLVDRSIWDFGPYWVRDPGLDAAREYRGEDPMPDQNTQRFIPWGQLESLSLRYHPKHNRWQQLKTPGFNGELPEDTDAFKFHRFFSIAKASASFLDPHAIVLVRDADTDDERRRGLKNLNEHYRDEPIPVIVGVPHPETECWLLAGFLHGIAPEEVQRLEEYKGETGGVDPCRDPHRLNNDNVSHPRNAKCALRTLCPSEERERQCLNAPFSDFQLFGRENGLDDFLTAVRTRLIPALFGGAAESPR